MTTDEVKWTQVTDGDCCGVELVVLAVRQSDGGGGEVGRVVSADLPEDARCTRLAAHLTDDGDVLVTDRR